MIILIKICNKMFSKLCKIRIIIYNKIKKMNNNKIILTNNSIK